MKKKITRIVSGTVSASILTASCNPMAYEDMDQSKKNDEKYMKTRSGTNGASVAIPVKITMDSDNAKYIFFLQNLASDIIKNPSIAREFLKSPSKYLSKYGYNKSINLDDHLLKVILTLGDNDAIAAINRNDIDDFVKICESKGLYSDQEKRIKEESNTLLLKALNNGTEPLKIQNPVAISPIIPFLFIAVAVVVVVVYAVTETEWDTEEISHQQAFDNKIQHLVDYQPYIQAYALREGWDKTYILVSDYTEKQIEQTTNYVKQTYPEITKNYSDVQIQNVIKLNLK